MEFWNMKFILRVKGHQNTTFTVSQHSSAPSASHWPNVTWKVFQKLVLLTSPVCLFLSGRRSCEHTLRLQNSHPAGKMELSEVHLLIIACNQPSLTDVKWLASFYIILALISSDAFGENHFTGLWHLRLSLKEKLWQENKNLRQPFQVQSSVMVASFSCLFRR